ncbi:MAG: peptide deformylase [Myxococcota bacterium]|jgi:peptide deformylase|nr:peptide deformylase [Myxococcota bacterium]
MERGTKPHWSPGWLPEAQWLQLELARDDVAAVDDEAAACFPLVTVHNDEGAVLRRRCWGLQWLQFVGMSWGEARDLLSGVARRLERSMYRYGGVGIAAPQVGLSLRAVCLRMGVQEQAARTVFALEPQILWRSASCREGREGCLSVPGLSGIVRRNEALRVLYLGLDGEHHELLVEGFDAVVWQHELDHLDGVLYLDRVQGEPVAELADEDDGA